MASREGHQAPHHVLSVATERHSTSSPGREDSTHGSFGVLGLESQRHETSRKAPCMRKWGIVAILISLVFLAMILVAIAVSREPDGHTFARIIHTHRVAFSSCTQRHMGENLIWEKAIIPADPDTWVWLGDLAYMDIPAVDCYLKENLEHPDCNCEPSLLRHPPHGCKSGDAQTARRKADAIVRSRGYSAFLEFMCPMHIIRAKTFPPPGRDPSVCPRAIFGVYDDHDFGWNNGNGYQLPNKAEIKQVYLDAIGEPPDSPRRQGNRGIYGWEVLNQGTSSEVDLLLLDERYQRVPLPCHTRARTCAAAESGISGNRQVWCEDFMGSGIGNITRPASCCHKDDDIARGWCQESGNTNDARYASACNPWDPSFGTVNWAVSDDGALQEADPQRWQDVTDESGFCEVLGRKQRQWLDDIIVRSRASITLVASGSVLMGRPQATNSRNDSPPFSGVCSGDDWDCYRPAQQNVLAALARKAGCVIVLTGDYHFADIKRIIPGEDATYTDEYMPPGLKKPIYQVMASGMDPSTATGLNTDCNEPCCGFQKDEAGLRGPGNACAVFGDPNFGTIDFNWHKRQIQMSIMNGNGSGLAIGAHGKPLQLTVNMDTCEPE